MVSLFSLSGTLEDWDAAVQKTENRLARVNEQRAKVRIPVRLLTGTQGFSFVYIQAYSSTTLPLTKYFCPVPQCFLIWGTGLRKRAQSRNGLQRRLDYCPTSREHESSRPPQLSPTGIQG